jgi:DNA-binding beta-propeller fold protein YncE
MNASAATLTAPKYVYDANWAKLPPGVEEWGVVPAVVVDRNDRIYVHRRNNPSVVVYDPDGNILKVWGEEGKQFAAGAHGLHLELEADGNEYLYFTDTKTHSVVKTDLDGREVWRLGTGQPADGAPFNRPTDISLTPEGDFYISDGYGNRRVHHYSKDLQLIRSWGEEGTGPGQFVLVHDVWFDTRGGQRRLWVADRTNNRIEIFTPDGQFVEEKTGLRRPNGMWVDRAGYMYVAELDQRVTIMDPQDNVIGYVGGHGADDLVGPEVERAYPAREPGTLLKPHCIWGDSQGSLYVAEVEDGARIQKFERV